jgi:adenylate kinase family enzyme
MKRVAVVGSASGNGKTTFGRELAERLGVPFVELDALNHGPNWTEATPEQLRAKVEPIVQEDAWVVDGGYRGKLGDLVLDHAELVVWLDLPMRVWLPRLLRRTVRRVVRREVLWNGNRETIRGVLFSRDSLLLYALRMHSRRRQRYPVELASFDVARLRTTAEVESFLRNAARAT